jgi:hypothetical protein
MSELITLIRGESPIDAITDYVDALDRERREAEVNVLGGKDQARLFEKAADAPPITLSHFVPDAIPALTPVHHPGRNTIATFGYFRNFQKRFTRPEGESARLFGYNASNAFFITPGYFVAEETAGNAEWEKRGGVVIDYHRVPDAAIPSAWPEVVPNSQGLQKLVHLNTRDFMRRVSEHVSIGRAAREDERGDVVLDYWFTLVRREPTLTDSDPRAKKEPRP